MLTSEIQQRLIDKLVQAVEPAFIILFGSFAQGIVHEESDIDLAYLSNKRLTPYERFMLVGELALIGEREIDLVDIMQIDTVLTMQIFSQGIPIYIHDENEFVRQRMRAYSMYVTLNGQRASVIEAIKERGSVFGDE